MDARPLLARRMPQLDVLRGLAIAMVVVYHGIFYSATHQPGRVANAITRATQPGAMGVNLFFVLSGFLITGILMDAKAPPDYFSNFYARRALRILPAYLLTIGVLVLLRLVSAGGAATTGSCRIAHDRQGFEPGRWVHGQQVRNAQPEPRHTARGARQRRNFSRRRTLSHPERLLCTCL